MDARRIAWLVAGVSALLAVVDTALVVASYPPLSARSIGIHGWPLVNVAGLGSAVLGAVILSAHPRHPIGWILNLVGLTTSISLAAESYGDLGAPVRRPRLHGAGHTSPAGSPRSSEGRWRWPASPARSCWCPRARTCRPGGAGSAAPRGRRTAASPSDSSWSARTASTATATPSTPVPSTGPAQRRRHPDHAAAPGERRGHAAPTPRLHRRSPPAAPGRHDRRRRRRRSRSSS